MPATVEGMALLEARPLRQTAQEIPALGPIAMRRKAFRDGAGGRSALHDAGTSPAGPMPSPASVLCQV